MKHDPKNAAQLATELRPFVEGRRNSCFSEIERLLKEILQYLEDKTEQQVTRVVARDWDPTIQNQLNLPLETSPVPGEIHFQSLENSECAQGR